MSRLLIKDTLNLPLHHISMLKLFIVLDTVPSNCSTGEVRLVGTEEGDKGRLEVCVNGAWGTVCGDGFDSYEAIVTCHSLGGFEINGTLSNTSLF